MYRTNGILEFEYLSKLKRVEFSLDISPGYGGLPMFILKDKNNKYHTFIRGRISGWDSLVRNLKWPADFLQILYIAFEDKYQEVTNSKAAD